MVNTVSSKCFVFTIQAVSTQEKSCRERRERRIYEGEEERRECEKERREGGGKKEREEKEGVRWMRRKRRR